MTQTVPVIYEDGVLRPLKRMRLPEHQRLMIRVELPPRDVEALQETVALLSDQPQLARIARALDHVRHGKLLSHADVFGHPQPT